MAKKLLPPWVCFHIVKHHLKPLLQHPRFLIHMYFAEYFWVLSITESARGCCERASFCINMFGATYRNPLGSPKRIQQAVHQPQTWVQRKTVCHHLSCSRWGLVFFFSCLSVGIMFLLTCTSSSSLSLISSFLSVISCFEHILLQQLIMPLVAPVIKNDDLSDYRFSVDYVNKRETCLHW